MTDSLIHLRVPVATKARWVRASRAASLRLTDWIVNAVEAYMQSQITAAVIPDGVQFSDLRLARDPDGMVSFDWSVIDRICAASGLSPSLLRDGPEDNAASLIVAWYNAHRAGGGAPDPIAEDLIAEVRIEDEHGGGFSHTPGRA